MRLLHTLALLAIAFHTTTARCKRPRPNPAVMGALQSILSPSNTERTMHMVQMAAQRNVEPTQPIPLHYPPPILPPSCNQPVQYSPPILPPSCNQPVQYSPPILPPPCNQPAQYSPPMLPPPCNQPVQYSPPNLPPPCNQPLQYSPPEPFNFPPNQLPMPSTLLPSLQLPSQMPVQLQPPNLMSQLQSQMPFHLQLPNPMPQLPSQMPAQLQLSNLMPQLHSQMPVQLPNPISLPSTMPMVSTFQQQPEVIWEQQREIIYPLEQPKPCPCQRELVYPTAEVPYTYPDEPVALAPTQDIYTFPIPSPAALFNPPVPPPTLFNPYLPAASPVSSWTQENLPTATSGTRSQYLRKIPIPPPTL